jgi:hypothetical protein
MTQAAGCFGLIIVIFTIIIKIDGSYVVAKRDAAPSKAMCSSGLGEVCVLVYASIKDTVDIFNTGIYEYTYFTQSRGMHSL